MCRGEPSLLVSAIGLGSVDLGDALEVGLLQIAEDLEDSAWLLEIIIN